MEPIRLDKRNQYNREPVRLYNHTGELIKVGQTPPVQQSQVYTFAFNTQQEEYLPKYTKSQNNDWIEFGKGNKFPLQIAEIYYTKSPFFKRIIDSLHNQIYGNGLKIKDGVQDAKLQAFLDVCNDKGQSLNDVTNKLILDNLLYDGFATFNQWESANPRFTIKHADFLSMRVGDADEDGLTNEYFWSKDWANYNPEYKKFNRFVPDKKSNVATVYYYYNQTPGICHYPLCKWIAIIPYLMAERKVIDFHNSNLDKGYFPSLFINMTNGVPSDERAKLIVDNFNRDFKGAGNAGTVIVNFSPNKETSPEITPINNNSNDSKFIEIVKELRQATISGMGIVSPELLGVQSTGLKLGGNELINAQTLLYKGIIEPAQNVICNHLNKLLRYNGFANEVYLESNQAIEFTYSDDLLSKILTINELRERIGKKPLDEGDVLLKTQAPIQIVNPNDKKDKENKDNATD